MGTSGSVLQDASMDIESQGAERPTHNYEGALMAKHGDDTEIKAMIARPGSTNGQLFEVDILFPKVLEGTVDTWGIDEGMAHLLTGLVRALKPQIVFETGTHRGRSTRAIAEGLVANKFGHLWTVDPKDYGLMSSGAIREEEKEFVTQVIGSTPDVFGEEPLIDLQGIEMAFLDGAHDGEGLSRDLEYVDAHRADECLVFVDNARDGGWPEIERLFDAYETYPHLSFPTLSGTEIVQMCKKGKLKHSHEYHTI